MQCPISIRSIVIGSMAVLFLLTDVAGAAPQQVDRKQFFDTVRAKYHPKGKFNQTQVDSYNGFIDYWESRADLDDPRWLAYALATAYHETRMQPVREGFCKTDQCSRRAVKRLWQRGRIKRNYAAADPKTGNSYYGRGYVQLTHAYNYKKMGRELGLGDKLYLEPDLVLQPEVATKILWIGMIKGSFRSPHKLSRYFNSRASDWVNAREIINGDKRKLGRQIGGYGQFYKAKAIRLVEAPPPVDVPEDLVTEVIQDEAVASVSPKPRPGPAEPAGQAGGATSVKPGGGADLGCDCAGNPTQTL